MRSKWTLVVGLCLALVVPAGAFAGAPASTSKQDTAVAYYLSPDGSECLIMTLTQGLYRPIGGDAWSYGQALDVQLAGVDCVGNAFGSASLDSSSYRIFGLTAAYVVVPSVDVEGRAVSVDVAWVATGTPKLEIEGTDQHPDWSFVGKDVGAHLTGMVLVEGVAWTANQEDAILRSFAVSKNF